MLGLLLVVWIGVVAILVAAPEVYDRSLGLLPGNRRLVELAFLGALSAFIALLAAGVLRRWRWTFWLITIAFLLGVLRVPASVLQLTGVLEADGPAWYVALQAVIGAAQVAIGVALLVGYRRAGVWGAF